MRPLEASNADDTVKEGFFGFVLFLPGGVQMCSGEVEGG